MIAQLFGIVGRFREESVFLPILSFGYIYAESDQLAPCSVVPPDLIELGLHSSIYLLFSFLSIIAGTYMYTARNRFVPSTLKEIFSIKVMLPILFLLLFLLSFVEVALRVCSRDIVIVGLCLTFSTLIAITGWESTNFASENRSG